MSTPVAVTSFCVAAGILTGAGIWTARRLRRRDPAKRERQRRLLVHQYGRLGDALITEATDSALYYSYSLRGVQYEASQDIASLRERLGESPERLIGSIAQMKCLSRNPANSILLCEEWSGLRPSHPVA